MGTEGILLSVIIPVYKVEKYLAQCIDSVLNQNLKDYEIILVEDGSPDRCPEICDTYAKANPEIKVIHQENSGLSSARNRGLKEARGKYIMYLDSDDWWNPSVNVMQMLQEVYEKQNVSVFLFSGLDYIQDVGLFERRDTITHDKKVVYDAVEYYQAMLKKGNLQVHAGTKILRRGFLIENELEFAKGIKGEDNEWMIRALRCNPSIAILPEPLYIYRAAREGSISNSITEDNVRNLLQIVKQSIDYYSIDCEDTIVKKYELCFCAYLWFSALGLSGKLSTAETAELSDLFVETSRVCVYSSSVKTVIAYLLYKIVGLKAARNVLSNYISCKNRLRLNKRKLK